MSNTPEDHLEAGEAEEEVGAVSGAAPLAHPAAAADTKARAAVEAIEHLACPSARSKLAELGSNTN